MIAGSGMNYLEPGFLQQASFARQKGSRGFYFCPPACVLHCSQQYDLPPRGFCSKSSTHDALVSSRKQQLQLASASTTQRKFRPIDFIANQRTMRQIAKRSKKRDQSEDVVRLG